MDRHLRTLCFWALHKTEECMGLGEARLLLTRDVKAFPAGSLSLRHGVVASLESLRAPT